MPDEAKTLMEKALDTKFEGIEAKIDAVEANQIKQEAITKLQETLQTQGDTLKTQGETLEEFLSNQVEKEKNNFQSQFSEFLTENKKEIDKIYKAGSGVVEFVPKVVGPMTTASGSVVGTPGYDPSHNLNGFNLTNHQYINALVSMFNTNQASYPYTELKPKEGDFGVVAEGGTKPQLDFSWVTRWAEPKKIAAHEVLTEEVIKDVPRMLSTGKDYLRKKHDLYKSKDILAYAVSIARTFVAGGMANALPVASFLDVINAIIVDMYTTHAYTDEMNYVPTIALMNPVDFWIYFTSAKDDNGLPMYPSATIGSTVSLGGLKIIPSELITAGNVFVADMSYVNMTNYVPYTVKIGWINDDFIKNQFVMLGESRYHLYTKEHEKGAFIYDDYATVKAAIDQVI